MFTKKIDTVRKHREPVTIEWLLRFKLMGPGNGFDPLSLVPFVLVESCCCWACSGSALLVDRHITFGIVVRGHVTACNPENLSGAGDISEHLRIHARMFGSICALVEGWHMIPVRGAHKENTLSEKVLLNHWPDCVLAKSTFSCSPQWTKLIAKLWMHRPPHSLISGYHHSLSLQTFGQFNSQPWGNGIHAVEQGVSVDGHDHGSWRCLVEIGQALDEILLKWCRHHDIVGRFDIM